MDILETFRETGVVPVVVIENAADSVPTAKALSAGGVDVMEITLRTSAAVESIKRVSGECPGTLVGAGTVISPEQCREAVEAGAKFIVSPGFSPRVVEWCLGNNIPVTPGCVTPTEIMAAMEYGLRVLKFFPGSVYGGIQALKALSAPFAEVSFIPTGGVNSDNLEEYIRAPFVHAVGGSWICTRSDISAGSFGHITGLAAAARQIVEHARNN